MLPHDGVVPHLLYALGLRYTDYTFILLRLGYLVYI